MTIYTGSILGLEPPPDGDPDTDYWVEESDRIDRD